MTHELLLPLVDEENICLPLPINVVARYWNVQLSLDQAANIAKKYQGFNGSVLIEGIELVEQNGLVCKIVRSNISELQDVIATGIPPIVILAGIPEITQHASVITGYNKEENTILHYIQKGTNEGEQQEGVIPLDIFEHEWSQEGDMMILVAPGDILSSISLNNSTSDTANRLCYTAERYILLNDHTAALESLNKATRLDPDNSNALQLLGSLYSGQNSEKCIEIYQKCIAINPKAYLAHNGLGNFYLKTNKFDQAIIHYTKAIEIDADRSAKIYKNRAYLQEKLGNNDAAIQDLKLYLKYAPRATDRGVIEQAIRQL